MANVCIISLEGTSVRADHEDLLLRITDIIRTASWMNVALRGHREVLGEGKCEGSNFLELVALVARYEV